MTIRRNSHKIAYLLAIVLIALLSTVAIGCVNETDADSNIVVNGIEYIQTSTSTVIVGHNNCDGDIVIPETIVYSDKTYTVTGLTSLAFKGCDTLISVSLPDSIESISYGAFEQCKSLQSVEFGEKLQIIYPYAFYGCSSLVSVDLPDTVTNIGNSSFQGCSGLQSVCIHSPLAIGQNTFCNCTSLSDINCEEIVSIGYKSFYGCSALISVKLSEDLQEIGYAAFSNCTSLKSVSILAESVNVCPYAFDNCLELSEFDFTKINNIQYYAFCSCSKLEDIILSDELSMIGDYAFYCCNNIKTVTLSETPIKIGVAAFSKCYSLYVFDFENVVSVGNSAFYHCYNLENIFFSDELSTIGDYAFCCCNNIKTVIMPDSPVSISNSAFSYCKSLSYFDFENVTSIGYSAFYECCALESIIFSDKLTNIGDIAFYKCVNLKTVIMPDSPVSISNNAFGYCTSLSYFDFENVTSVGQGAFLDCSLLKTVNFTDEITYIGSLAFYTCNIDEIYLGKSVVIGDRAFGATTFYGNDKQTLIEDYSDLAGCTYKKFDDYKLYRCSNVFFSNNGGDMILSECYVKTGEEFVLPQYEGESQNHRFLGWYYKGILYNPGDLIVKSEEDMTFDAVLNLIGYPVNVTIDGIGYRLFKDHTAQVTRSEVSGDVTIPATVIYENKRYSVVGIGHNAFYGCSEMTSVEIPESLCYIENYAFYNCVQLEAVLLPEACTKLGSYAFAYCKSLSTINLDNVEIIMSGAFCECTSLTSITLPDTLSSIPDYTFYKCTGLTSVEIPDTITEIGYYAFAFCTSLSDIDLSNVTTVLDGAFVMCTSLRTINFTDSITHIGVSSFNGCNISEIYIGKNAELMKNAFGITVFYENDRTTIISDTSDIVGYNYLSFETNKLYRIQNVFFDANGGSIESSAYSIEEGTSFTLPVYDGELENFKFNGWYYDGVTYKTGTKIIKTGSDMRFSAVWVPAYYPVVVTVDGINYRLLSSGTAEVSSNNVSGEVIIPESIKFNYRDYLVIGVGYDAFKDNVELESITFSQITYINSNAFINCTKLKSVYLGESDVRIGSYVFSGCSSLETADMKNVSSLGYYAFSKCSSLTSADLSKSDYIGYGAFYMCNKLLSVSVSDNLEVISPYTFAGCSSLEGFDFRNICDIGYNAFSGCNSLTQVEFSDSLNYIGNYAFSDCYDLTTVSTNDSQISIGYAAFEHCQSLCEFDFEQVAYISNYAFYGCDKLEIVRTSDLLEYIGYCAFTGGSIEEIYFGMNVLVSERAFVDKVFYDTDRTTVITDLTELKGNKFLAFEIDKFYKDGVEEILAVTSIDETSVANLDNNAASAISAETSTKVNVSAEDTFSVGTGIIGGIVALIAIIIMSVIVVNRKH